MLLAFGYNILLSAAAHRRICVANYDHFNEVDNDEGDEAIKLNSECTVRGRGAVVQS